MNSTNQDKNSGELLSKHKLTDIGKTIREIRKMSSLTQEDLADKIGTKRAYISRIEKDASNVKLSTLIKILEEGLGARIDLRVNI